MSLVNRDDFITNMRVYGRRAGHSHLNYGDLSKVDKRLELGIKAFPYSPRKPAMFIVAGNEFIGKQNRMELSAVTAEVYFTIIDGSKENTTDLISYALEKLGLGIYGYQYIDIDVFLKKLIGNRNAEKSTVGSVIAKRLAGINRQVRFGTNSDDSFQ